MALSLFELNPRNANGSLSIILPVQKYFVNLYLSVGDQHESNESVKRFKGEQQVCHLKVILLTQRSQTHIENYRRFLISRDLLLLFACLLPRTVN